MADLIPSAPVQRLVDSDLLGCVLHQDMVFGKQSKDWLDLHHPPQLISCAGATYRALQCWPIS